MNVFKGELYSFNDEIGVALRKVVAKVTPPGAIVAYVSNGKVVQVHQSESAEVQFKYFVAENELLGVQKRFFIATPVASSVVETAKGTSSQRSEQDEDQGVEVETANDGTNPTISVPENKAGL